MSPIYKHVSGSIISDVGLW